jgi:hypothetical protein
MHLPTTTILLALFTGAGTVLALSSSLNTTSTFLLHSDPWCLSPARRIDIEANKCYRISGMRTAEIQGANGTSSQLSKNEVWRWG